ncbi:MAG: protein-(glutamine-N5) methyltransferase, release factor-specific [Deltaproteobacteria bacterium RIFCSPHIGHO2_02_FULL_40_11]|nr:MAG: protein-(glutamine-N5) methyltransferase, release factor-specific [Deltaproteobacteria bacterium RIFCSPHIGHO2_02_FULL_40_11]
MKQSVWTVKKLLDWAETYLKNQGFQKPRIDAEYLLADVLQKKRLELYLKFDQPLSVEELTKFKAYLKRRTLFEPLQYILGHQAFWSFEFKVGPGVLIPRPETEFLVETVLKSIPKDGPVHILDLCTGSGVIPITVALERKNASFVAIDSSQKALRYAKENAKTHGVEDRIQFLEANLFDPLSSKDIFDIIVSNPPYVAEKEWETLDKEILMFEPKEAFVAGPEGTVFHYTILKKAKSFLKKGGTLFLEISPEQSLTLKTFCKDLKGVISTEVLCDYTHRERVLRLSHG